jgi:hypothetical protein
MKVHYRRRWKGWTLTKIKEAFVSASSSQTIYFDQAKDKLVEISGWTTFFIHFLFAVPVVVDGLKPLTLG